MARPNSTLDRPDPSMGGWLVLGCAALLGASITAMVFKTCVCAPPPEAAEAGFTQPRVVSGVVMEGVVRSEPRITVKSEAVTVEPVTIFAPLDDEFFPVDDERLAGRAEWFARPEFECSSERFLAHFAAFGKGLIEGELELAWGIPGVRVAFFNVQSARAERQYWLVSQSAAEGDHERDLLAYIESECAAIAALMERSEEWTAFVALTNASE